MVDFRQFNSVDAVVAEVKADCSGTLFEYEFLAFENHQEYIEFRVDSDERFLDSWVARIGEASDFRDMFGRVSGQYEYDESSFKQALAGSDKTSYLDALKFARDVLQYRRNEIVEASIELSKIVEELLFTGVSTVSDRDVLDALVRVYNFPGKSDDEARDIVESFIGEVRDDFVEFQEFVDQLDVVDLDEETDEELSSKIRELSVGGFVVAVLDEEIRMLESEIRLYRFEEFISNPEVGEYYVHYTPFAASAVDGVESDGKMVFQTLLEVTDVYTVEKDGVEVTNFEYDVVAVDEALNSVFPNHYVGGEQMPLGPPQQDYLSRYSGAVDSFETRVGLEESGFSRIK